MYKKLVPFVLFCLISLCNSTQAEIPISTDSRIKKYVYNENDVYLVVVSTGFQSSIEFEPNEKVQTLSLGDSYSWNITPLDNRLIIKPMENNLHTNMMVITNLRTYQFDIVSKSPTGDDTDISYVVRFYYPALKTKTRLDTTQEG